MKAKAKLPAGMSHHARGIMGRTTVRYRDGRTKRETVYGKTVAEVADKLQRIQQVATKLADPKKRPVGEFLALWLDRIRPTSNEPEKPQVRYNTYSQRRAVFKLVGDDVQFSRLHLAQIDERDVTDVLARLTAAGIGSRTVQITYEAMRSAFKWALKERWLTEDVMMRVDKPPHRSGVKCMWTSEQHRTFLAYVAKPFDEARFRGQQHRRGLDIERLESDARRENLVYTTLFALLATTGMRIGEALALRWQNVDLEASTIYVEATLTRVPNAAGGHVLAPTPPKTRESRRPVGVSDMIRTALAQLRDLGLSDYAFASATGQPLERGNVGRTFSVFCNRAEVPTVAMHSLRATVATAFAARSENTMVLTKSLGWTDPKTAAKYYTKASAEITGAFRTTMLQALGESGVQSGVQKP